MKKQINEKTFELNITNELLNISRSFIWYLEDSPLCLLFPREVWRQFLNDTVLYAEGLTQDEEASSGGGYDVSINVNKSGLFDRRLLMLQFKSGIKKKYHLKNSQSQFHRDKKQKPFIEYSINDAANLSQHIILRDLANNSQIQTKSVMYVFPRITERTDFHSKIGSLLLHTSFVPVVDIDQQGRDQIPTVVINSGEIHKYRTSYDGNISEVNLLLLVLNYQFDITSKILSELICIQIERLFKIMKKYELAHLKPEFIFSLKSRLREFISKELSKLQKWEIILEIVNSYIESIFEQESQIPQAPSKYSTIIPSTGFTIHFDKKLDTSSILYQVI